MTLVSGNVNYLWIFESVPRITVVKPVWGGWNRRIYVRMLWLRKFWK